LPMADIDPQCSAFCHSPSLPNDLASVALLLYKLSCKKCAKKDKKFFPIPIVF
jgi:hypothetical protein